MTRKLTLFLVCAFEIALILFVAAWNVRADNSGIPKSHWIVVEVRFYSNNRDAGLSQGPQSTFENRKKCEAFLSSRLQQDESIRNTGRGLVVYGGEYNQWIKKCVNIFVTK
jgi:hypothetical protein